MLINSLKERMGNPIDIAKERAPLNYAQIIGLIAFVASVAWTLAGIFFEFKTHETEMKVMRERIEYVSERVDRKVVPLKKEINELKKFHIEK